VSEEHYEALVKMFLEMANRPLTPQNAFSVGNTRGKIRPIADTIPLALIGDDRPAPELETWLLRKLTGRRRPWVNRSRRWTCAARKVMSCD
jgi:hypothetical protein